MANKNKISVQIASRSYLLEQISAIEIRDSRLNLVKQLRGGQVAELADGVYEISAVLEDGQKYRRMVHLQGGEQEAIILDSRMGLEATGYSEIVARPALVPKEEPDLVAVQSPDFTSDPEMREAAEVELEESPEKVAVQFPDFAGNLNMPGAEREFEELPDAPAVPLPEPAPMELPRVVPVTAPAITFIAAHGATLKEKHSADSRTSWVFEAAPNMDAVPKADFLIAGRKVTISLPVNPEGYYPLNACEVVTIRNAVAPELRAWISPERTVASTMQHMLESGFMLKAAKIAGEALELLRDKYQDPTGALLGALLLHKVGQLEPHLSWVTNLARDFDWLNDGKVLLALLLSKKEQHREQALSLALRASSNRMMFTESYSLLLDLLRRWPWPGNEEERYQALNSLAMMTSYTNWDSMMFYQIDSEEE